jgi:hypothetical protein
MFVQYEGYASVQRRSVHETVALKAVTLGEVSKPVLYTGAFGRIRVNAGAQHTNIVSALDLVALAFGAAPPISNRIKSSTHAEFVKSIDGRGNRGEVILS